VDAATVIRQNGEKSFQESRTSAGRSGFIAVDQALADLVACGHVARNGQRPIVSLSSHASRISRTGGGAVLNRVWLDVCPRPSA
jgi:hypothetical protein